MRLTVNEIFFSIQGESTHAGRPCAFIRLTGCNLRCDYCDTAYAYDEGTPQSISDILKKISAFPVRLVEITGGEPLLQPETPQLIRQLLDAGYEVMLETNGSLDISSVDPRCIRIVDMKCPSSGESSKNLVSNLSHLTPRDQVKFVIGTPEDYNYAAALLPSIPERVPRHHILFSPVSGKISLALLAEWILRDHLPVRLHFQLHKLIWPEADRGC